MTHPISSSRGTWLSRAAVAASRFSSRILLAVEGVHERSVLEHELVRLDAQGDLERVLSDAGMSRSEMSRLINGHPGASGQLAEMMGRVGADRTDLHATAAARSALRAVERECTSCDSWRECRGWLASHATDNGYRAFCPNAETLEEMREQQARLRAERGRPAHYRA